MDLLDHIRAGEREIIDGTLKRPAAVVLGGEVACLDLRAHPAVEYDDALLKGREIEISVLHKAEA